jgi:DNA helicase II / ATP-dependent DNA helicase PcrA
MAGQRQVIRSESILPPSALLTHGRIFAGPGAGKTHFLVENVKSIIKNQLSKTNAVQKVLCITYTNAAVDEIANRLDNFSTACEVSTIHSFLIQNVIGPFQSDLRSLMQEDFSLEVKGVKPISSQIEGVGILHGIDKKEISQFVNDDLRPSETIAVDQFSKKMLGDIEVDVSPFRDLSDGALVKCSIKHSKQIDDRVAKSVKKYTWSIVRKLTHDEILYFGFRILQRSPVALLSVRTKFPYIFVDEFQDTSPVQTRILELIGERFSKIYVVGDLCQSIYSFQGAKPDDFSNFKIKGSNPIADYEIKENRRSTSNIVSFCNFLRQKEGLIQRSFRSYKSLEEKENCESEKIHFLIGGSAKVNEEIDKLHKAGAVILTRTWAATFQYIEGVSESQTKILTSIYFSYNDYRARCW